jgi:hypothetical protein
MKLPHLISGRNRSLGAPSTRPHRRRRSAVFALEEIESRVVPSSLPMTFQVPGALANMGVYVGITGQLEQAYTPTQGPYAGQALPGGTWVVLAANAGSSLTSTDYAPAAPQTTVTQSFSPGSTGATMDVATTFGFPSTGDLALTGTGTSPPQTTVAYTSVTQGASFNNVTYVAGSSGATFSSGSQVVLANQDLPLLNLFPNPGTYPTDNTPVTVQVSIPSYTVAPITSGQVVMSVGAPMRLAVNSNGTIASPTAATNPDDKFGLFEWGWDTQGGAQPSGALDIDISEVDQVGFPFQATITNPNIPITGVSYSGGVATITTSTANNLQAGDTVAISGVGGATNVNGTTFVYQPAQPNQFQVALPVGLGGTYTSGGTVSLLMPAPAQDGVGLSQDQTTLFGGFGPFLALVASQNPAANAQVFNEGGPNAPGAPFPANTRLTAPQDVVGKLEGQPSFVGGTGVQPVQYASGGNLTINTTYYYAITAVGPTGAESMATVPQISTTPQSTAILNWEPYAYATGYNVYRSTSENAAANQLVNPIKLNASPIPIPTAVATIPGSLTLPSGTITVASTTNMSAFPTVGSLMITGQGDTPQLVQYSGVNAGTFTFTGVTLGTGTFAAGATATLLPQFVDNGSAGSMGLGSATVPNSLTLPSSTITVASNTNMSAFPSAGFLTITGQGNTPQFVSYTGLSASTFTFTGVVLGTGTFSAGATVELVPPTSNYNYDLLNQYFTTAIGNFFNYYAQNTFSIDLGGADDTTFVGSTTTIGGYTVLNLTGQAGQYGNTYAGKTVHIYEPFFSSNTNQNIPGVTSYPPAPSFLTGSQVSESPSAMIFGADGVFDQSDTSSTAPLAVQKDVENAIASAFNRGLTPVFVAGGTWTNVLPPNYWANDPNPLIGSAVTTTIPPGNQALSGTYYYAITAINVNSSDTPQGETTPSNLITVNVSGGNNAVLLQWKSVNPTASANITASNPSMDMLTVDNVASFPASGDLVITVGGMNELFSYGSITPASPGPGGTFNNVAVLTMGGTFPTSGVVFGNIGSPTVAGFNIYRGTSPNNLTLIATVPNGSPPVAGFVDTGYTNPSKPTPPAFTYYAPGSTANYYAAYLHLQQVSINGLAYGFPYDDQGGFSTNIQMRTPQGVTITLQPWTTVAPPSPAPAAIALLGAPASDTAGQTFPVTVALETSSGAPDTGFTGTVHFVISDPQATPIGDYTFLPSDQGKHVFDVTLRTAGTEMVLVKDSADNLVAVATVVVQPAAANHIAFLALPSEAFVQSPLGVYVEVLDVYGNLVPDAQGIVTLNGFAGSGRKLARVNDGVALFIVAPGRPGVYTLTASSPWGPGTSGGLPVSSTAYFTLAGPRLVSKGTVFNLTVVARTRRRAFDRFYQGRVDLYAGLQKIASVQAAGGVARFSVALSTSGRTVLTARDDLMGTVIGRKLVISGP